MVAGLIVLGGCGKGGDSGKPSPRPRRSASTRPRRSATPTATPTATAAAETPERRAAAARLRAVKKWAYLLYPDDPAKAVSELAAGPWEMVVIEDFSTLRDTARTDTAALVRKLQAKGKLVLGYLDVGDVESDRTYWEKGWKTGSPGFVGPVDPDTGEGLYLARFWEPGWADLTRRHVEGLVAAGFDGVWVDRVDAGSYAQDESLAPDGRRKMADLVVGLAAAARTRKPGFLVVPIGEPDMVEYGDFVTAVDGVGVDGLFYVDGEEQEASFTSDATAALQGWKKANRPVFSVDYTDDGQQAAEAYFKAGKQGFVEYVAPPELAEVTKYPPPG